MRVWTNGEAAGVLVDGTLYRLSGGALSVEARPGKQEGALTESPDEVVAWSPHAGKRLDGALAAGRAEVLDAVALDEQRLAAVLRPGRKPPRLVVGPPAGPFEADLELKAGGARVSWPAGVVWSKPKAPPRGAVFEGPSPRGVRVHGSRHGVGVGAAASGHVAVLRPGASSLDFVLRVPGQHEARLDVVPTAEGALVTLVVEGRHGAVVHLDRGGGLLGSWPTGLGWGCFPALALADERVLAFDKEQDTLVLLALPGLEEVSRLEMPAWIVEAAAAPDGYRFALADAATLYMGMVIGGRLVLDPPRALADARRPATVEETAPSYVPCPAVGPPQVAFPTVKRASPPWNAAAGGEVELALLVRSGGSAARGLRLELSGPALAEGLVEPVAARCGDEEVAFRREGERALAVLANAWLPCGIALPLDPRPKGDDAKAAGEEALASTHLEVSVRGRAVAPGRALLTVAISAEGSETPPMRWTRPVTVG